MEDIGSLIFYVVLGILALAGSFQGKGKKKPGAPGGTVQRNPENAAPLPQTRRETVTTRPQPAAARPFEPAPRPAPKYIPAESSMEGRYDEPMAREFGREGSYDEPMAREFDWEGGLGEPLAKAFSNEGSITGRMAAAFASEGISAFGSSVPAEFTHNEISDTEIGDAPEYDYNVAPGSELLTDGFDLKKAVIYSSVLDRKEYSY
jgi:hypothetical protein